MKFKVGDYLKRLAPYVGVCVKLRQVIRINESYYLIDLNRPEGKPFPLSRSFLENKYSLSSKEECQMLLMEESLNGNNS